METIETTIKETVVRIVDKNSAQSQQNQHIQSLTSDEREHNLTETHDIIRARKLKMNLKHSSAPSLKTVAYFNQKKLDLGM